jgi:hypothetical protein
MPCHRLPRIAATALALTLCSTFGMACGGGSIPGRPIETLIYVSGPTGAQFSLPDVANPACGSTGTGIQAPNASHQFPGRLFQAPHLFVLENVRQPVRAVIQNQSDTALQVNTFLGETGQNTNVQIPPGQCQTVITNNIINSPLTPNPRGHQTQVEVCSPLNATNDPDLQIGCVGMPVDPNDRAIAYFATIGDIASTNITNCLLPSLLDACRSPTTFFLEQPQDEVDAVMSVNSGQNPPGQPIAQLRLELYINGQRVSSDAGTNPVVSYHF